jgi:hypothetical protein
MLAIIPPFSPVTHVIGSRVATHHSILIAATAIAAVEPPLLVGTLIWIVPTLFVVTAGMRAFPIIIVRRC